QSSYPTFVCSSFVLFTGHCKEWLKMPNDRYTVQLGRRNWPTWQLLPVHCQLAFFLRLKTLLIIPTRTFVSFSLLQTYNFCEHLSFQSSSAFSSLPSEYFSRSKASRCQQLSFKL